LEQSLVLEIKLASRHRLIVVDVLLGYLIHAFAGLRISVSGGLFLYQSRFLIGALLI
jgi:hypothetical protein